MNIHIRANGRWLLASAVTAFVSGGISAAYASQDEVRVRNERAAQATIVAARKPGAESKSLTVRYDDLDLSADAGNRTLYRRLTSAARTVCGPAPGHDLAQHRDWSDCYQGALDAAVAEIGRAHV